VPVSAAEHWEEDGVHVFRSLEFNVIAGHEDFNTAVDQFVEKAEDLWTYLSELDGLTDNENETFLILSPRFRQILKVLERREEERLRRLVTVKVRRRSAHSRAWEPKSRQPKSSVMSPA
jgi:hypothetical protein